MPVASDLKIISARVSPRLHEATVRLAKRENKSVNELVAAAVAERVKRQEEQDLYDAFTLLGRDGADVEFAAGAQAEIADGE